MPKIAHTSGPHAEIKEEYECQAERQPEAVAGRFAGTFHAVKFGLEARMSGWSHALMRPDQILASVGVQEGM